MPAGSGVEVKAKNNAVNTTTAAVVMHIRLEIFTAMMQIIMGFARR
jgi:hypothetical protein